MYKIDKFCASCHLVVFMHLIKAEGFDIKATSILLAQHLG